jgi:anti-anti-sigma regulatory factor
MTAFLDDSKAQLYSDASDELALSVELHDRGADCVLRLRGALTGESIMALEAQIDQIGCASWDRVVLDVSGLTRLDDVGNRVLAGLHHYMHGRGGTLVVSGAREAILARILRGPYELVPNPDAFDYLTWPKGAASAARGTRCVRFAKPVEEQSSRPNSR